MTVINPTIEKICDIAKDDRGKSHSAPVLRETVETERFRDDGGEDAEDEAVSDC